MLNPDAIQGTNDRKHTCPMFFVNYLPQKKSSETDGDGGNQMFGIYGDKTLIPAEQKLVSKIADDIDMVGENPV